MCLASWLGIQHLGYSEFSVAGKTVLGGTFRAVLSAQFALDAFEQEVRSELTVLESWEVLSRSCPQFGFSGIAFRIGDVTQRWGKSAGWQTRIDFPGHGYINLWRESDAKSRGIVAVLFIDCVSRAFSQKLDALEVLQHK
jgi:hypothetical protein